MYDVFESMKYISDRLVDRISKEIFANKVMFSITNDVMYLRHIFDIIDNEYKLLPMFNKHKNQAKIIFGCGKKGVFIKKCFPEIDWKCYVDNNVKPGSIIEGVPVISVEELRRSYPDAYIIVSPRYDYKNIAKQLRSFVDKENIWLYGEKMDFLASKIYFDLPYLTHCDNEIFVDGGVLDGDSSMAFVKWCGGEYGHIHMFEPNPIVHQNINNRMMHVGDKISLHKAGLWNGKDSLSFLVNENHLSGAKIVEDVRESDYTINVIDLDSVLHEGATFIKMDIEGAEKQALLGAKKIIRRYHPKLAISVYHKKDDLWEIPKIILNIDPEYKLYLRHYCLSAGDTVLYAV